MLRTRAQEEADGCNFGAERSRGVHRDARVSGMCTRMSPPILCAVYVYAIFPVMSSVRCVLTPFPSPSPSTSGAAAEPKVRGRRYEASLLSLRIRRDCAPTKTTSCCQCRWQREHWKYTISCSCRTHKQQCAATYGSGVAMA